MAHEAFRPFDRIVIPVQGTDREFLAQQSAVEIAGAMGLPVVAIHIAPGVGDTPPDVFRYIEQLGRKHDVHVEGKEIHSEDIVSELVEELTTRDLCLIGTRKLSHHYHVGSVAAGLIEKAPCPVQVVRIE